nr:DUF3021 domain-containing protein [Novibacillus thermophilus]
MVLTVLNVLAIEVPVSKLWTDMAVSLALGIYFGLSSLMFDIERWSRLKQTVIHGLTSLAVFFPTAIRLNWIPLDRGVMMTCLLIFLTIYVLFWFCAWWYYKRLAQSMNEIVKK